MPTELLLKTLGNIRFYQTIKDYFQISSTEGIFLFAPAPTFQKHLLSVGKGETLTKTKSNMKANISVALIISLIPFLMACPTKDDGDDTGDNTHSIALLKVDFTTNTFEGGKEIDLSANLTATDSIPLRIDYTAPGDFGSIALYAQPSDQLVFDGTIIWMGKGEMSFPSSFASPEPENFPRLAVPLEQPSASDFQKIFDNIEDKEIDYEGIWDSIKHLKIVEDYRASNKRIGLFLYTPSVGIGDPKDWDWYVMLGK
ncbi:hypothetical protein R9C00_06860 [Flammeovirgaceae bacterium SG7u.111]|nr:hypothetical protein [Flammeovirgaceae bacterium SG7u.132]WPO37163.1 hypothetical protein R9C00_06860 [Flammeovirgaceae bacterium SG7u.111]